MVIIVIKQKESRAVLPCPQDVLCTFVHGTNEIQTLKWVLLQAQEKQQEHVRETIEPSLAKDLVAQTHKQAASKVPGYFT